MYKAIICFDLDGTLLDAQEKIRQPDFDILRDNKYYLFIPATGRSYESVIQLFHKNKLYEDQKFPLPLITLNGGVAFAPQEKKAVEFLFSKEEKQAFKDVISENKHISFLLQSQTESFLIWPNTFSLECVSRYNLRNAPADQMPENFEFVKVMCFCGESNEMQQFVDSVEDLPIEKAFGTPFIYEFTPQGVNKASALKMLIEKMGQAHLPIFAAGDGGNDVETFKISNRSFAPMGSLKFVCEAADEIIETDGKGLLPQIIEKVTVMTE